jgi:hypothetical protein
MIGIYHSRMAKKPASEPMISMKPPPGFRGAVQRVKRARPELSSRTAVIAAAVFEMDRRLAEQGGKAAQQA